MEGYITLRNLRLSYSHGLDAWGRPGKAQPILVSVRLRHKNIQPAASSDDCSKTTSYSDVAKAVIKAYETAAPSPERGVDQANDLLMVQMDAFQATEMVIETTFPKGALRIDGGYGLRTHSKSPGQISDRVDVFIDLKLACIIGVNPHEREQKQMVVLNLELWRADDGLLLWILDPVPGETLPRQVHWHNCHQLLVSEVVKHTEGSSFETVEALALMLLQIIERQHRWVKAVVHVEKPSAIAIADLCGAELHQSWNPRSWL